MPAYRVAIKTLTGKTDLTYTLAHVQELNYIHQTGKFPIFRRSPEVKLLMDYHCFARRLILPPKDLHIYKERLVAPGAHEYIPASRPWRYALTERGLVMMRQTTIEVRPLPEMREVLYRIGTREFKTAALGEVPNYLIERGYVVAHATGTGGGLRWGLALTTKGAAFFEQVKNERAIYYATQPEGSTWPGETVTTATARHLNDLKRAARAKTPLRGRLAEVARASKTKADLKAEAAARAAEALRDIETKRAAKELRKNRSKCFYTPFINRDTWAAEAPEALAKLEAVKGKANLEQISLLREAFMDTLPVAADAFCDTDVPLQSATTIINCLDKIEQLRKKVELSTYAKHTRAHLDLFVQALKCAGKDDAVHQLLTQLAAAWLEIKPNE